MVVSQNTTTTKTTRYPMSNVFVTGCDHNTEWQLPWFIENFERYNDTKLIIADFGIMNYPDGDYTYIDMSRNKAQGWFKKPSTLISVAELGYDKVCWIDTDCQVLDDISDIFSYSERDKLGMVEDRPWSSRRPEMGAWYNSGVVLIEGIPLVLRDWERECINNPTQGDQEVLYLLMEGNAIKKLGAINPLPHEYNTLRLDYIDKIDVKNPKIVHHTGEKGNNVIRELINA